MKKKPQNVTLAIRLLDPHPRNANKLSDLHQAKLRAHIAATGNYPPLIVRPHPESKGRYQIIDGHYRCAALRALGHQMAHCQIWEVDETQTLILLATLNRLSGADETHLRANLLNELAQEFDISQLAELLPLEAEVIQKYIDAANAPPAPAAPKPIEDQTVALTIFVPACEKTELVKRLKLLAPDLADALRDALKMAELYREIPPAEHVRSTPDRKDRASDDGT